jgi:hypothetical protein
VERCLKKEMKRCKGPGAWFADGMGEWGAEHDDQENAGTEDQEDAEGDELEDQERRDAADADEEGDLQCSPVTVIYGHAGESGVRVPPSRAVLTVLPAGRGLDIKPFSKGIDTGCVVSSCGTSTLWSRTKLTQCCSMADNSRRWSSGTSLA